MASNYTAIGGENRQRYGTDIGRIGPMLLADRYDDRTHFIFELLQNAEDALGRQLDATAPRGVSFCLNPESLVLSHFGRPFDEADVRGVCGIAESTKDKHAIGRFGIGFKSVYTFTDRPEIHSGNEDFAVENYVQPTCTQRKERRPEETLIVLPLRLDDGTAHREIIGGFKRLGPGALLFLRNIDEITWRVAGEASGVYLRSSPEPLGSNVQRVTVIGQESGQQEVDQNWLVFHREVFPPGNEKVGHVEIAFSIVPVKDVPNRWSVQPVAASPLVVYFPTVVSTNLGFLVQGPYRTTPSRDNIPRGDPWNQYLVKETAELLVDALRWLRDQAMLDTSALRCLPLDREKFSEGSMFTPLFDRVREALTQEALLPRFGGGYVSARQAKLARTQDLRELFNPEQLAALGGDDLAAWLAGDITQDRAPEIRQYVIHELDVTEVTPATIVPRLTKDFLEAQTDDWIVKLYEFASGQEAAFRRHLDTIPLIRLSDGTHVVARENGKSKAFLPSTIETSFPTMRREVCATPEVRAFLTTLGITEPDPVDDVVWNVLPKYQQHEVSVSVDGYAADIGRIRTAFSTDSKVQREKLLTALRETSFLMVVDTGDNKRYISKPGSVYLATDRLKRLFTGVPGVLIVDESYACLSGENMRELMEACGALRYPRPLDAPNTLTGDERRELRRLAGHEETSYQRDRIEDWNLRGFDALVGSLPALPPEERIQRARLIWESLGDLEERRGRGIFEGTYSWSHYGSYKKDFPAAFVRHLNSAPWVPDASGELHQPSFVVFDTLGWKGNPFLLTKIDFKPPIIDQLARETGIDPAALDLLKKLGITSVADLTSRLGIDLSSGGEERGAPPRAAGVLG
ncbi:sacsin N-terminal ATP-binding-like domain-containing protein, partial [Paraburkholderia sediminicola]|uniref:sacsin N-terminal ATP-binding-like domain-containing protein n=1 Tax=Paraburkholderia sediminicola TaxID=458836 RepID=UPI0038BADF38